jgi:hypothetical protein
MSDAQGKPIAAPDVLELVDERMVQVVLVPGLGITGQNDRRT